MSCVSHPCLGTVPRAGEQTSPSLAAIPLPPLPGSPVHSQALPPPSITLSSGYHPYAPFSLPLRRNGSSEREITWSRALSWKTSGSDLNLGWETPKHVPQPLLQMPRLGLVFGVLDPSQCFRTTKVAQPHNLVMWFPRLSLHNGKMKRDEAHA